MYRAMLEVDGLEITIHDPMPEKNAPKLQTGSIKKSVNEIASFSFRLLPNNPGYLEIYPRKTRIKVEDARIGKVVFEGRVLMPKPSMEADGSLSKDVTCEGVAAYLHDSIQPYIEEKYWEGDQERNGLEEFIDHLLKNHNDQVEEEKRIYRGVVDVHPFKESDNITKGLNYEDTYNVIKQKLVGSFGGEFDVRRGPDGRLYLDYKEEMGSLKSTTLKVGVNIQAQAQEQDPSEIVTRIIPLGAKIKEIVKDENGNESEKETGDRLTIAPVNEGRIYLDNEDGIKKYGIVPGIVTFDDVNIASILLQKGREELINRSLAVVNNTVTALDLSLIDKNYESYEIYNKYPVENKFIGINEVVRVVGQTIDIVNPEESTLEFGSKKTLQSDHTLNNEISHGQLVEKVEKIESDYQINQSNTDKRIENIEKQLRLELSSNHGIYQRKKATGGVDPDYTKDPLMITPTVYLKNAIQKENLEFVWKRKTGSEEEDLVPGETDQAGTLSVSRNLEDQVRYICYVTYTTESGKAYVANAWQDYAVIADGAAGVPGPQGKPGTDGKDAAVISDKEPADKTMMWCDTSMNPPQDKAVEWEKVDHCQ